MHYRGGGIDLKNLYFGYYGDGVKATEHYTVVFTWWPLPVVTVKVGAEQMGVGSRGFAVP
jgi:hypothetical protein